MRAKEKEGEARRGTPLEAPLCPGQARGLSSCSAKPGACLELSRGTQLCRRAGSRVAVSLWLSCRVLLHAVCYWLRGKKRKALFWERGSIFFVCDLIFLFLLNHGLFLFGNPENSVVDRIHTK